MTSTARQTTRLTPRCVLPLLWTIAVLGLAADAAAQGSACDQFKATLAARIEAGGVRGYSLEAVPAATPVPAGAKAIGHCEGGALKILYRRWGGASGPAPAPAQSDAPVLAPEPPPKRQAPAVRLELPAPVASQLTPKPVLVPIRAPEPAKPEPEPVRQKAAEPVRQAEAALPIAAPAALVVAAEPSELSSGMPSLSQRVSSFISQHWHWLLALLTVPFAALGWFWRAHHLAYDRNGLPRGPRL